MKCRKKKCCKKQTVICASQNGFNGFNGQNGTNGPPGAIGPQGPPGPISLGSIMVISGLPPTTQNTNILTNQAVPYNTPLLQNSSVAIFQNQGWIFSEGSYLVTITLQTVSTTNSGDGSLLSLVNVASNLQVGTPLNLYNQGAPPPDHLLYSFMYNFKVTIDSLSAGYIETRFIEAPIPAGASILLPSLPQGSSSYFGSWIIQKLS